MFLCFDLPNLSSTLNLTIIELDDGKILTGSPIFDGKNHGFPVDFPLKQPNETTVYQVFCRRISRRFSAFQKSLRADGRCRLSGFPHRKLDQCPGPCLVFWAFQCISYVISIGCIHGIYMAYIQYMHIYAYMAKENEVWHLESPLFGWKHGMIWAICATKWDGLEV